jgi:hypothetical protein
MKKFWILSTAVFAMFLVASCGSESSNEPAGGNEDDFKAVDVGECRFDEPPLSFKDRIYTEQKDEFSCKEYVEVTEKAEKTIKFNWFGEMHCGIDWEYGYKIEGIENNVLKVSILERDTDLDLAAGCDDCCYLMPIEYTASSAEEIDSIKTIEINYEGKNHKVAFPIDKETPEENNDEDQNPEGGEDNLLCEYDGETGYEAGDIMPAYDSCQPWTCKNGEFIGLDDNFCDGCRYWNDPEKEGELKEMMKLSCNGGEVEIDWCECVPSDSPSGKKWFCGYAYGCQCIYQGKRYDLGYEIATDFCQTSICGGGSFDFLSYEACDYCYYYDETEEASKQAEIGGKQSFTCPDGSKVDWCECVADDVLGQKWKCADRADLNCPKE